MDMTDRTTAARRTVRRNPWGPIAYGAVFTLLVPMLAAAWAWRLDRVGPALWPLPLAAPAGAFLLSAGLLLLVAGMAALGRRGGGLPMNAYPPPRLVTAAVYGFVAHPIYAGFVAAVAGTSVLAGSPAGFWIVVPLVALAAAALVAGYEEPALRRRFPAAARRWPLLGLPPADDLPVPLWRRWGAAALALAPWALAYALLSAMPEPAGARELRMAGDEVIPLVGWTVWIYSAAYPLALAAPMLIDRRRDLRRFVLSAWGITLAGYAAMLLLPGRAALLPVPATGATAWLFSANRALDAEWLACPSFHAAWSVLAACAIADRRPRLRWPAAALAFLICASCLATGSHALADVAAGALLGLAAWHQGALWRRMVGAAERLANAWNAVQVGPVRVIGHAPWSALAAAAGMLVVVRLSGPERIPVAAAVFAAGLLAAGAWGHVLEGGGRLSRPFGYYGFLFGALAALAGLAALDPDGADAALRLAAAFAVAAPLAQALGRLRCLVQGCCHGRPVRSVPGLRVIHPMSRVTALAGLRGVAIHPTQLYSLVGNLAVFAVLARLWEAGVPASFVGGAYLLLTSLARFVEEQYRGEPQTPVRYGLAVYQWLALGVFVAGILVTMLAGPSVAAAAPLTTGGVLLAGAAGLCAALFMSVDFPGSRHRFSRLTVGSSE